MEISFRTMAQEDIAPTAALWRAGWLEAHAAIVPPRLTALRTLESFHARLEEHMERARLALAGSEIAGFAIVKGDELYQFYIAPGARGTGVSGQLMADAEAILRAEGHSRAWLACSVGNIRAAQFYENTGWTRVATEAHPVDTSAGPFTLDVWRYEKDLAG